MFVSFVDGGLDDVARCNLSSMHAPRTLYSLSPMLSISTNHQGAAVVCVLEFLATDSDGTRRTIEIVEQRQDELADRQRKSKIS